MASQDQAMIPGERIDLDDDLQLQELVDLVQELLDLPIHVSLLTDEQWRRTLEQLASGNRNDRFLHLHVLPDPREGQSHHLLVSRMAVRGINAGRGPEITQTVNALLSISGPTLPPVIRSGLHDLLLGLVRQRSGLDFPTGLKPRDRQFVHRLVEVLALETSYTRMEWVREIKKQPDVLFRALRRSAFAAYWAKQVRASEPQLAHVFHGYKNGRAAFVGELEKAQPGDEIVRVTDRLLRTWLPMEKERLREEREGQAKESDHAAQ